MSLEAELKPAARRPRPGLEGETDRARAIAKTDRSGPDGTGRRIGVVLFNLGGPDGPASVRPFLRNLFSDPAIIAAPAIIRLPLARLASGLRARAASANYTLMGGGSPLLAQTREQARALAEALARRRPQDRVEVLIAMRYWEPTSETALAALRAFDPDVTILAPLYPQYSTATTGSSLAAWRSAGGGGAAICCWHANEGLIAGHAQRILECWAQAGWPKVRLLFSAHGLPRRIADSGDPYAWQVVSTCERIVERLGDGWDWRVCFQSRVGPVAWLEPSTPEAIAAAVADGLGVLIDPVSFVSEHIETLVELDRDYAELARRLGAAVYLRAAAVGTAPAFIDGLADAVERALDRGAGGPDGAACPGQLARCGRREAAWSTTS